MFVKNLLDKALHKQHELISAHDASKKKSTEIDVQIAVHYGTPYTASTMAFDPIQRLLAIGTLDGRIKIIGGDNIEGLLISPKKVPYKHLEFLQNRGFLVAITNENEVQVWNLEFRQLFCSSQWETNITAFAVVPGTSFIFLGDENGLFSVLKYDLEDGKIITMPYHIPLDSLAGWDFLKYLACTRLLIVVGVVKFWPTTANLRWLNQPGSKPNKLYGVTFVVYWCHSLILFKICIRV